jgi:hypothetical protein
MRVAQSRCEALSAAWANLVNGATLPRQIGIAEKPLPQIPHYPFDLVDVHRLGFVGRDLHIVMTGLAGLLVQGFRAVGVNMGMPTWTKASQIPLQTAVLEAVESLHLLQGGADELSALVGDLPVGQITEALQLGLVAFTDEPHDHTLCRSFSINANHLMAMEGQLFAEVEKLQEAYVISAMTHTVALVAIIVSYVLFHDPT